jgi:ribosomal protein S4
MRNSIGRAYFDKKIAEGKTRNEAMRCLKRRLANHIWRMMIADEQRLVADPSGIEIAA